MFRLWGNEEPFTATADHMDYTAVEEGLSEEELRVLSRGGARICSSHHRAAPSQVSSATSSSASVATSAASTTALVRNKRQPSHTRRPLLTLWSKPRMEPGMQRERNLLISQPSLPTPVIMAVKPKPMLDQEMVVYGMGKPLQQPEAPPELRTHPHTYIPQVLAAISVSLGSMIVGFVSGYSSPALPSMASDTATLGVVTETQQSWIGSLLPLLAIFGGMVGGPAIDRLGRRTTIILTALPFLISFLLIAFAQNLTMIFMARGLAGFCTGIISLALPVYLGETIQSEVRGVLGLMPTSVGNLGLLLSFFAGKYLNWSQLALLGAAIPIPFIVCMFLIPETPQWYISKEKKKRGRKALQWLRGRYSDVSKEFGEIEKNHHESQLEETSAGICDLLSRRYCKPLLISLGLMLFQQMSGINAVMFYNQKIFQESKTSIDKDLCSIIIGLVNLGTVFVSTTLIDRLGRKILLYTSSVLTFITITTLGVYFYFIEFAPHISVDHLGWLPLTSFIVYIIGFSIGFGPIPWLMMGEILPAKIRGSGASIATSFNWFTTFVVTKTFNKEWGFCIPFLTYGVCCFLSLFFVMLFVPETQGKSLEDIERNLTGEGPKIPVRTAARRMSSIANLKPSPISI